MIRLLETQKSVLTKSVSSFNQPKGSNNTESCRSCRRKCIVEDFKGQITGAYGEYQTSSFKSAGQVENHILSAGTEDLSIDFVFEGVANFCDNHSKPKVITSQKPGDNVKECPKKFDDVRENTNVCRAILDKSTHAMPELTEQGKEKTCQQIETQEFSGIRGGFTRRTVPTCHKAYTKGNIPNNLKEESTEEQMLTDTQDSILKSLDLYDDFKFWEDFFERDILMFTALTEKEELVSCDNDNSAGGAVRDFVFVLLRMEL